MDLSNLGTVDPFADLDAAADEAAEKKKKKKKPKDEDADLGGGKGDLIHIRVQQRNGRKCITTIQGLDAALDLKKILKAIKKDQCCNGSKLRPFFLAALRLLFATREKSRRGVERASRGRRRRAESTARPMPTA